VYKGGAKYRQLRHDYFIEKLQSDGALDNAKNADDLIVRLFDLGKKYYDEYDEQN
jgi:hypothetical protein